MNYRKLAEEAAKKIHGDRDSLQAQVIRDNTILIIEDAFEQLIELLKRKPK